MVSTDRRGQVFTVEGFVAAFLLLASVAFAIQMTAVSPLSSSTSSQEVENQQAAMARGVLDSAIADGALGPALLHWNATSGSFHDTVPGTLYYTQCSTPTAFGGVLERTFEDASVACNVNLGFVRPDGSLGTRRLVYSGVPTDGAVHAVTSVTLYDDDRLYDDAGNETATTLAAVEADGNATFYAPDADPAGPVYNVIRVEVVVWRT